MGLLNNLFGKSDGPVKTAEMLDEDLYWRIVERSLEETEDQDEQEQYLIKEIGKLSPKQMIGFRLRTDQLLYDTYNSEMWCAGYIMNQGCSDDGFEYFRNWVISRGKDVYYNAKENPTVLSQKWKMGKNMILNLFGMLRWRHFKRKPTRTYMII
jgi:Protein of unknown function (DUF4240)